MRALRGTGCRSRSPRHTRAFRGTRNVLASVVAFGAFGLSALPALACSVTATGTSFGTYDVFASAPLDTTGEVSVTCPDPPPPSVQIAISKGSSVNFQPRTMLNGANDVLEYGLYLDATFSIVWGDGSSGTEIRTVSVPTDGTPAKATVYGRIPARQTSVSAGTYQDTVTVTVNF